MLQAPGFECFAFDPFSFVQNGLGTSEVDIGWRDVVEALVVSLVIVMIDEGFDLRFQIARKEVVFQQNPVLQGLMPSFDFALCLGVVWRTTRVFHAFVVQPFCKVARDVTGTVVTQKGAACETREPGRSLTLAKPDPAYQSPLQFACSCKASTQ